MAPGRLPLALALLVTTSMISALAAATPPRPGTENNSLSENESATLWSRDDDHYITAETYRDAYGEERTAMQELANGTDITFKRPPETASIWTRNDHRDYTPGNSTTSVYPEHASLTNSTFIEDAHATFFSVTPSTKTHTASTETRWYVAPAGQVRGTVDYRVRVPSTVQVGNRTISWTLHRHEISEVRLLQDGEVIARSEGSHRPTLSYQISGRNSTLTLEADIKVWLAKSVTAPNGTRANDSVTGAAPSQHQPTEQLVVDEVTASDTVTVDVYDPTVAFHYARYPNGDTGVYVFQNQPWQGYRLTSNGSVRVRGVWRFYTAREPNWDTLTRSHGNETDTVSSDARPVYVHAYPSELGPRADPPGGPVEIVEIWGSKRASPAPGLHPNVTIDVVTNPYTASYGVAVRTDTFEEAAFTVNGIVRGVNATLTTRSGETERQIRASRLTTEILKTNKSGALVRLELRDAETGEPISLTNPADPRDILVSRDRRTGHVSIAGKQVETNASGLATVYLNESGVYTARYHPGSWLTHDPAYVSDTATVRWHPLTTISGWFALLIRAGMWFLPFLLAVYAGRQLGTIFNIGGDY